MLRREIAPALGYDVQFKRLNSLIGALLGTHEARILTAKQALARAAGRPYDPHTPGTSRAEIERRWYAWFCSASRRHSEPYRLSA
jgi:hypothetical protein